MKSVKELRQQIKELNALINDLGADPMLGWMTLNLDRNDRSWIMHRAALMKRRRKQKNLWPVGCFFPTCQKARGIG